MSKSDGDYRREGERAYGYGQPRDCPYKSKRIVDAWLAGYDDAKRRQEQWDADAKAQKLALLDEQIQQAEVRLADLRHEREYVEKNGYRASMWGVR